MREEIIISLAVIAAGIYSLMTKSDSVRVLALFVVLVGVLLIATGCSTIQHVPMEDDYVQEETDPYTEECYCSYPKVQPVQKAG